jgi:hypothetical protein
MHQEFNKGKVPTLHLSYHLGEHYNSVRHVNDSCNGPATDYPIGSNLVKLNDQESVDTTEEFKSAQELIS